VLYTVNISFFLREWLASVYQLIRHRGRIWFQIHLTAKHELYLKGHYYTVYKGKSPEVFLVSFCI
jgi:hypothetical protein